MGDGSRDRDGGGTLQYQCSKMKRKKKRTKKTKKMKRTCNDGDSEMKTRMKRKTKRKKMRNNEWGLVHRESAPAAFDTGGDSPRQPWP